MEQERHKKEQKMKESKNIECKMVWKDKKEGKKEIRKYNFWPRKKIHFEKLKLDFYVSFSGRNKYIFADFASEIRIRTCFDPPLHTCSSSVGV